MKRRSFLKLGASLSIIPMLPGCAASNAVEHIKDGEVITAAHWGTLKLTVKDGKVVKSEPYKKRSEIYNALQYYTPDMIYKSRVKYPYVRKSYLENPNNPKPELRGKDEWVRVSYEKAIALIAEELKKTRMAKKGVFAGSYGWKSSGNVHNSVVLLQRFMNLTGGFVGGLGDYSTGASQIIMPHVVGSLEVYEQQTSWQNILENSKIVVIWGANPIATLRISWTASDEMGHHYFEKLKQKAQEGKIKIISIDPQYNETAEYLNAEWIAPNPNTDVAMMLGMAHHLIRKNKVAKDFLEDYTTGYEEFKKYVLGKGFDKVEKTPKWASKICGLDEKVITALADRFYANPTMLMSGWGMQRAHHGEQPHWMLVTLACMLGQIGTKGGGFGLSYHYSNGGVPTCKGGVLGGINASLFGNWDKDYKFLGASASQTKDGGAEWLSAATDSAIPVARIADMLQNPGKTINHNGKKITYEDIDFIYWVGGNPFCHHQNTKNLVKAWQKPRTVVVNEIYWTPTAKMADIVMPATSEYERDDITMLGDYSNLGIAPMKAAVAAVGESRDDYQIFSDLALYYGKNVYNAYTENGKKPLDFVKQFYDGAKKQVDAVDEVKKQTGEMEENEFSAPDFDVFWKENKPIYFESTQEAEEFTRFADFLEDPVLEALGTPSGLIEIYSKTIEGFNYEGCKAHPAWLEPIEYLGNATPKAPFHMISPHPTDRLHSQLCHTSLRDTYAQSGHEPVWINDQDAKKLGIKTGDLVRVFNERGSVIAGAFVTNRVKKSVVKLCEGGWYDPDENGNCKYGSANVLTIDMPTSELANGNISHTALVNIEKYTGTAPTITAFSNPKIVK